MKLFKILLAGIALASTACAARADIDYPCNPGEFSSVQVSVTKGWNMKVLCNTRFRTFYNLDLKQPVLVAEVIKASDVQGEASRGSNQFYVDSRVKASQQVNSEEVKAAQGIFDFDRGHLAAAANYREASEVKQTFAFTNVVAMEERLNRGIWSQLEKRARVLAKKYGEVKVTSIVANDCRFAKSNGIVPAGFYKVIERKAPEISPYATQTEVYFVPNVAPEDGASIKDFRIDNKKGFEGVGSWNAGYQMCGLSGVQL